MKKSRAIIKIIIKTLLLAVISIAIFLGCTYIFSDHKNTDGDIFRTEKQDSYDVLVFGSSQVQYSFNPAFFKQFTGLNSYVLGSGCQNMSVTYAYMQEALKTQSPNYFILDLYTLTQTSLDSCYVDEMVYSGSLNLTGKQRYQALEGIKDISGDSAYYSYLFDLSFNHDKWKNYTFDDVVNSLKGKPELEVKNPTYGYVYNSFEDNYTYTPVYVYEDESVSLTSLDTKYLDKIIKLCKDKNIQLILYKACTDVSQQDQAKIRELLKYGKANGAWVANYIDQAQDIEFYFDRDGDTFHNNVWGAYKTTKALADMFVQHNATYDNNSNSEVNKTMKNLSNEFSLDAINHYDNIYKILEMINELKTPVFVYYQPDGKTCVGDSDSTFIDDMLNISNDFTDTKNNYYAYINGNGSLVFESNEYGSGNDDNVSFSFTDNKLTINNNDIDINTGLAFIIYDSYKDNYVVINIGLDQTYFWRSQCYEQECKFD